MLAFVFWMQAIGQVLVYAVALIVIQVQHPWLSGCELVRENGTVKPLEGSCLTNLDMTWRWVVGLGAVPAAIAIFFRLTIPQSPRYLMDVADNVDRAVEDTADYYGPAEVPIQMQQSQTVPLTYNAPNGNANYPYHVATGPSSPGARLRENSEDAASNTLARSGSRASTVPSVVPPLTARASIVGGPQYREPWWSEFKDYFFRQGNWRLLAGTAGSWFLLDLPFYGIELSSANIINAVWVSTIHFVSMYALTRLKEIVHRGRLKRSGERPV